MQQSQLQVAIISGGTATNALVPHFRAMASHVSYILPISDNGGSTSELIRVIGGPAIGDIRSRLTRLIPENQKALRRLLGFRLSEDPVVAKAEWNDLVDGSHELWRDIEPARREIFRAFIIHVNVELLKRSKHQSAVKTTKKQFRYELASIGNLFLTGARLFIGSLDSAVELFSRLSGIDPDVEVLPCINTNFSYHISALLQNGLIITGQSQISHPSEDQTPDNYPPPITVNHSLTTGDQIEQGSDFSEISDDEETGSVPQYTHPELKKSQLHFSKSDGLTPLLSPIERIFYVSPYGEEIRPTAHHKVCTTLSNADVVIYSIGSLMTSIVPVVVLKGVGKAIASELTNGGTKKRILLLNGCSDRETHGMEASDYIRVIVESASYSFRKQGGTDGDWRRFVSYLFYMSDSKIRVDKDLIASRGVECVEVRRESADSDCFDLTDLEAKLRMVTNV
ncbi:UPF0052-domain-containing protein [Yamadazyma tenuis ATCC 10573]|uniref:UPF0052-domain-containing protein n=1 Tax=Candida tenuis (strain ATCC 10573 / BCRC 21748 / CBS 615 / JCM 9827 / NBRC 10315 / NRRL Y-1498 / VKM Y-70) TaxID=590646 RepID=G3BFH3_CANTC|nr:UPF0052-domain-containing protein [Yamadazyma tenuis ATCC 10573]EGV60692.1 UPF0052-domain-containing protein [Yamadazyma tenuis ATCC 10573]